MKTLRTASLLLPLAALLAAAPFAFAEETDAPPPDAPFKPKQYDLSKYSSNFEKKSPFEYDPPPPAETIKEDHFDGVSLAGFCGDGPKLTVYLIVGKEKKRITVHGDGSPFRKMDDSGFRIVSIRRAKSIGATTVTLEKNGQTGEVRFEKDTLMAKGQGGQAGGGQVQMVVGPDGKTLVPRPVIPRPAGAPGGQVQPYQAPAPFTPTQGAVGAGAVNVGGGQPGAVGMNVQQNVNQMLTTPNVPNPPVIPGQPGGVPQQGPPRRRVVLPTQNP